MPDRALDSNDDLIAEPAAGGISRSREASLDPIAEPPAEPPRSPRPTATPVGQDAIESLDEQIQRYREVGASVADCVRLALGNVVGDRFGLMTRDEKGAFIEKLRFLLLKSDHRIVCPKCGQPSLPYFLSGTTTGTFQLQHKHANPTTHVVYGPRGRKFTFPQLTLVHVEPTEIRDAEK